MYIYIYTVYIYIYLLFFSQSAGNSLEILDTYQTWNILDILGPFRSTLFPEGPPIQCCSWVHSRPACVALNVFSACWKTHAVRICLLHVTVPCKFRSSLEDFEVNESPDVLINHDLVDSDTIVPFARPAGIWPRRWFSSISLTASLLDIFCLLSIPSRSFNRYVALIKHGKRWFIYHNGKCSLAHDRQYMATWLVVLSWCSCPFLFLTGPNWFFWCSGLNKQPVWNSADGIPSQLGWPSPACLELRSSHGIPRERMEMIYKWSMLTISMLIFPPG